MELEKAIEILEKHNEWRRDENIPPKTDMQNPTDIGKAIDYALIQLKKLRVADVIKNEVTVCEHLETENLYCEVGWSIEGKRCKKCKQTVL